MCMVTMGRLKAVAGFMYLSYVSTIALIDYQPELYTPKAVRPCFFARVAGNARRAVVRRNLVLTDLAVLRLIVTCGVLRVICQGSACSTHRTCSSTRCSCISPCWASGALRRVGLMAELSCHARQTPIADGHIDEGARLTSTCRQGARNGCWRRGRHHRGL